jgi:glycosyltransferase involved in cell wall biosynthesis
MRGLRGQALHKLEASAFTIDHPSVSVIIATHRSPDCLAQALLSIQLQAGYSGHIETIVVDDGSGPSFRAEYEATVHRFSGQKYFSVHLVHLPSQLGLANARNVGIAYSSGKLIAFLEDGDSWLPRKLQRSYAAMHMLKAEFVCTKVRDSNEPPRCCSCFGRDAWYKPTLQTFGGGSSDRDGGMIIPSSVLLRRSLLVCPENHAVFEVALAKNRDVWCHVLQPMFPNGKPPLYVYLAEYLVLHDSRRL